MSPSIFSLVLFLFCLDNAFASKKDRLSGALSFRHVGLERTPVNVEATQALLLDIQSQKHITNDLFARGDFGAEAKSTLIRDERWDFRPQDLSINQIWGGTGIGAGMIATVWEGVDGLNPMDILASRDLRDPLNSIPMAAPTLRLYHIEGNHRLDAILIPEQVNSRLPSSESPWWPRSSNLPLSDVANNDVEYRLPSTIQYQVNSPEVNNRAKKWNSGLRWRWSGEKYEFNFAAAEGFFGAPELLPTLNATLVSISPKTILQLESPVEIQPVMFRKRAFAAVGAANFETWIFRLGGQQVGALGEDVRKPGLNQWMIASIEKHFSIFKESWIVVFQRSWNGKSSPTGVFGQGNLFQEAWFAGIRLAWTDNWLWSVDGAWDLPSGSSVVKGSIKYRWTDSWSTQIGGEWLQGEKTSLISVLRNQDRVFAATTFSF